MASSDAINPADFNCRVKSIWSYLGQLTDTLRSADPTEIVWALTCEHVADRIQSTPGISTWAISARSIRPGIE